MSNAQNPLHAALDHAQASRRDTLKAAYPTLFLRPDYQYHWPVGWHRLVEQACAVLHEEEPQSHWLQIKEKFGTLRLYFAGGPLWMDLQQPGGLLSLPVWSEAGPKAPQTHSRLQALTQDSARTCACCSAPAAMTRREGYFITLCPACARRHGAITVVPGRE